MTTQACQPTLGQPSAGRRPLPDQRGIACGWAWCAMCHVCVPEAPLASLPSVCKKRVRLHRVGVYNACSLVQREACSVNWQPPNLGAFHAACSCRTLQPPSCWPLSSAVYEFVCFMWRVSGCMLEPDACTACVCCRARGLYDKMGRKSQFILYERERCAVQASADAALLAPMHPEQHKQNQTFK